VLNSLNVSASLVKETIINSKTNFLPNIAAMITEHRDDLAGFFRDDRRGQKLPDYFTQLPVVLEKEKAVALTELDSLMQNIAQIKIIVASQQAHVNLDAANETVDVHELLEDALKFGAATCQQDAISVVRRFDVLPPARFDRHKALQILTHLLANAHDAVMTKPAKDRRIVVTARSGAPGALEIIIEDNGCGVAPEYLTRIFQLGYTTKVDGLGLGLHYSACAARELHGDLTASSPGIGSGASFLLVLPVEPHAA
jgi:C4-dicarboxylate-specific signal transduction histidine kinase